MDILYPIRKADGRDRTSPDETITEKFRQDPHGCWLARISHLWHRGIPVSRVSAPETVLTAENTDKECMAAGEVAARPGVFLNAMSEQGACACGRGITLDELCAIAPQAKREVLETYVNAFNDGFKTYGINRCREKAHFLAQVCHESSGLRLTKETGGERKNYAPWYGRGLIQLTHMDAYKQYGCSSNADFTSDDMTRNKLASPPHCVLSAFWFYVSYDNENVNDYAATDDFNMVTACVNGGFNGYKSREAYFYNAVKVLHAEHLNIMAADGIFNFGDSAIYNNRVYAYSWGRYHDPLSDERGTNKDKVKALEAYRRALSLYEKVRDEKKIAAISTRIARLE